MDFGQAVFIAWLAAALVRCMAIKSPGWGIAAQLALVGFAYVVWISL